MKDFYLTLISNSQYDLNPSNTSSLFMVQLPRKITLNEGYLVGLAEIQFPYNFFNVTENNNNTYTCVLGDRKFKGSVTPGFYKTVNDIIDEVLVKTRENLGEWLEIDCKTNRIKIIRTPQIEASQNYSLELEKHSISFAFHGRLATQLGFPPDKNVFKYELSPFVGNVCFGIPEQMMVYCDLIEPQLIGYDSSQIIKIINTTEVESKFGTPCHRSFHKIHYVPVLKKEFDSVEINIRDITGELFPFRHGIVMVKLHFKDGRKTDN